jgi:hypothetical protein
MYLCRNYLENIIKFGIYIVCVFLTGYAFSGMSNTGLFTSVIYAIVIEMMLSQSIYWLKRAKNILASKNETCETILEKINYILFELNSAVLTIIIGVSVSQKLLMPIRRFYDLELLIIAFTVIYGLRLISSHYKESQLREYCNQFK